MYLIVYKKGDNLYSQIANKVTDKYDYLNEKFERVRLNYRHKIASFNMDSLDDLKKNIVELAKFKLRIWIAELKFKDKTQITVRMDLLNNAFYGAVLAEREEKNEILEDGKVATRIIQISSLDDYIEAEKEFKFVSTFGSDLFDTFKEIPYNADKGETYNA